MKQETLKKAKDLEHDISEYSDLLRSRNASYGTMLIKITCAYANDHEDYHGRVDQEVWDKMLDVVAEERRKAMRELENLTDTINAVMKYQGYSSPEQVYATELPIILGTLNTMSKEAKEIEKMNAKIKRKG